MRINQTANRGFTLFEMAIVLLIIGLLAASVLVGRELIHQAKLRSLISDEQHYVTAVVAFRLKYNALPGDMANATKYWGPLACTGNTNFGPATCTGTTNGNGDGHITDAEMIVVWQQLALAGLIPGSYAGTPVNGNYGMLTNWGNIELNLPKTALFQVYPMMWYEGTPVPNQADPISSNGFYINNTDIGHVLVYGTPLAVDESGSGPFTNWPSMCTSDAATIDGKMDDGNPTTGKVQSLGWGSAQPPSYTNGSSSCVRYSSLYDHSTYSYNIAYTGQAGCALAFTNILQ